MEKCELLLKIIIKGVICDELRSRIMCVDFGCVCPKKKNYFFVNLITCGRLKRSNRWQLSERIRGGIVYQRSVIYKRWHEPNFFTFT